MAWDVYRLKHDSYFFIPTHHAHLQSFTLSNKREIITPYVCILIYSLLSTFTAVISFDPYNDVVK